MTNIKYLIYSFKEVYHNGKTFFFLYIFRALLTSGKVFFIAWLSKKLFNEILSGIICNSISVSLILFAVAVIFMDIFFSLVNLIIDYYSEISATKYNNEFTKKNSIKCGKLKFEYHDSPSDKNELKQFLNDGKSVINIFCQTITVIFSTISFVVSVCISIRFSIIITVFSFIAAIPSFFVRNKNKNADYKLEKELNLVDRKIDYYKGIYTGRSYYKELHLFGALPFFGQLLNDALNVRLERRIQLRKTKLLREIALLCAYALVNIIINLYIIIYVVIKQLTIGDYTYYTYIINNLKNNSDTIISSVNEILISLKKVENYYSFYYNSDNEYPFGSQDMPKVVQSIKLIHVSFKYPNSDEFVIKDVSFEINKNQKIALAGGNGAGKSTLINLILRFYEPTSGQILLNDTDIRVFNLHSYWSYFSCMFQYSNLYNISLRENLLLGNIDMIDYIKSETLMALLANMEISLDKYMLDRQISKQFHNDGIIFSPGQAQRINVIRTLIRNSFILVLDEPSSSMDANTEASILKAIFSCSNNKFLFFISHRLSNLKSVDKIIFLDNGKVAESGTHDELMENKASYYELYKKQSNGYL